MRCKGIICLVTFIVALMLQTSCSEYINELKSSQDYDIFSEHHNQTNSLFGFECKGYKYNQEVNRWAYGSFTNLPWNEVLENGTRQIILCANVTNGQWFTDIGGTQIDTVLFGIGAFWISFPIEDFVFEEPIEAINPDSVFRVQTFTKLPNYYCPVNHFLEFSSFSYILDEVSDDVIEGRFTAEVFIDFIDSPETLFFDNGKFRLLRKKQYKTYSYSEWLEHVIVGE